MNIGPMAGVTWWMPPSRVGRPLPRHPRAISLAGRARRGTPIALARIVDAAGVDHRYQAVRIHREVLGRSLPPSAARVYSGVVEAGSSATTRPLHVDRRADPRSAAYWGAVRIGGVGGVDTTGMARFFGKVDHLPTIRDDQTDAMLRPTTCFWFRCPSSRGCHLFDQAAHLLSARARAPSGSSRGGEIAHGHRCGPIISDRTPITSSRRRRVPTLARHGDPHLLRKRSQTSAWAHLLVGDFLAAP